MYEFETTVAGIPCICRVTYYDAGTNYIITSASLEPNDPEEFEFEILDRKGYRAAWLERKLADGDAERLLVEYKEELTLEEMP